MFPDWFVGRKTVEQRFVYVSFFLAFDECTMSYYRALSDDERSTRHKSRKPKFKGIPFQHLRDKGPHTTSSKRIRLDDNGDIEFDATHSYRFVDFINVFSTLSQFLICRDCQKDVKFTERSMKGLGFQLMITCQYVKVR